MPHNASSYHTQPRARSEYLFPHFMAAPALHLSHRTQLKHMREHSSCTHHPHSFPTVEPNGVHLALEATTPSCPPPNMTDGPTCRSESGRTNAATCGYSPAQRTLCTSAILPEFRSGSCGSGFPSFCHASLAPSPRSPPRPPRLLPLPMAAASRPDALWLGTGEAAKPASASCCRNCSRRPSSLSRVGWERKLSRHHLRTSPYEPVRRCAP